MWFAIEDGKLWNEMWVLFWYGAHKKQMLETWEGW